MLNKVCWGLGLFFWAFVIAALATGCDKSYEHERIANSVGGKLDFENIYENDDCIVYYVKREKYPAFLYTEKKKGDPLCSVTPLSQ